MTSSEIHRQIVAPESATIPRRVASERMSGMWSREGARPSRAGSSQTMAVTWMATSGGKGRGSAGPGAFLEASHSLLKEAFAPLRDDLPAGVETGSDFGVAQPGRSEEHDPGSDHVTIRQRIPAGLRLEQPALFSAQLDGIGALPRHRHPAKGGRTLLRRLLEIYVTVIMTREGTKLLASEP